MSPVRVALVTRHFNVAGSLGRYSVELARYLVSAGHEVSVFSIAAVTNPELVEGAAFLPVPVALSSSGRTGRAIEVASFARNVARMLTPRRSQFDVVHARAPSTSLGDILHLSGVVEGEVRRFFEARGPVGLVRRLGDLALPVARPILTARSVLEQRALRNPSLAHIHVDSHQVEEDLLRAYAVDPGKVSVVSPGVNRDEFRPAEDREAVRRELGLPPGETMVLFCGHDFGRKGLDRAVVAVSRMRERAHLVVVGGGEASRFSALAGRLGVGDRLHFAGQRSDAWRYFQAADIFTLPTRVEMWGTTVVEAMASGVPPVVTSVAGSAEVVESGETGFVLPDFHIDLLAQMLDRLAANPGLRERMGAAARERTKALTWTEHGRRVEEAMLDLRERRSAERGQALVGAAGA
jgi:glycosyltransferase involved in cell wall biosynthesis